MSITRHLAGHGTERPHAPALTCEGESLTYGTLATLVQRIAARFGAAPEGGIALDLPNGAALAVLFLAAAHAGREGQVLDPSWPAGQRADILARIRPGLLVSCGADADVRLSPAQGLAGLAEAVGAGADAVKEPPDPDLPLYVGFTSGSTGLPKGYRRAHRSWTESFDADTREFGIGPDDVVLAPGALTHSLFLYALARGLDAGAHVILSKSFRPRAVADLAHRHQASVLYGVPTQLALLLDHLQAEGAQLDHVRLVLCSGAKWTAGRKALLSRHLPKAGFAEFYGASELSFITVAKGEEAVPEGSVGRAFDGVRLAIRDKAGRRLPAGRTGLVFVESPFLFLDYATGDSEDLLRHGAEISVGDMGRLDAAGFLTLAGRAKRMIVTSGKNLYPEEVERQLELHPAIAAAAVMGVPDGKRGERLVAFLQPEEGAQMGASVTRADLVAWLRPRLALFKVPRLYARVARWPLTASGKTDFAAVARLWPHGCELIS
ncbi:AMP-binding protein [Xanthobacter oligotrophicus]|uniref:AMP-binding protein n=1 Tax=Xanthobacter oligotrophicus TaxID=2607286 RepID=UPI0011F369EE|nr:AMP-binding protein [Xanthobacter oligotrophicus]MCG5234978.1 AMP-binding protein [Xanthobacter oligotrophicus]